MANKIKHLGIVENIQGSYVRVRIQQTSACSSCSVKGHCNASETKEKLIDVYNRNNLDCQVGDQVWIVGATSMGMKAVWLAFGFPFLILLSVLFITMRLTDGNEAFSALVALLMLIPYYLIIYMCRNKLSRTFVFVLETIK
ncbi:SoxR reducing system RseC family protein [Phocaeicola sp.]|jgi:sigma-E factor negative regulatory protein RseC|uniref:SoxR reducing system RseC family protein n=1 Tax=Phocaeicola sp. TaxID=2773926 RepID=UPI00386D47B1